MAAPHQAALLRGLPAPMVSVVLGLAVVASSIGGGLGGDSGAPFPWDKVRLPEHVVPLHYHLLIHPNLTTQTFTGTAAIDLTVTRQTSAVILHSKRLHVAWAAIRAQEARVLEQQALEQVALLAAEPLRAGHNYTVTIQYTANLSDSFHGFYKSTYRTQEGELR